MVRCVLFSLLVAGGLVLGTTDVHVVKKGDTLYGLSQRYDTSIGAILKANDGKLTRKTVLRIGQRIQLPQQQKPESTDKTALTETPEADDQKPSEPPTTGGSTAENSGEVASEDMAKTVPKKEKASQERVEQVYRVRKGDTLYRIGQRFEMSVSQIKKLNGMRSDRLSVGEKLKILAEAGSKDASPPTPRYLFIDDVKEQIDGVKLNPERWKYIVAHHSGTRSGNAKIFHHFHKNIRGMENGLAYHFVIGNGKDSGDGEIEVGDRWRKQLQGGHLASEELNEEAIGICFVGDFNKSRPTKKQVAAAIELISYLRKVTTSDPNFMAHREINPKPTECPGKKFPVRVFHELFPET